MSRSACGYIDFTPAPGSFGEINAVCAAVAELLKGLPAGVGVKFEHNGRTVLAQPGDSAEDIHRRWMGWTRQAARPTP